MTRLRAHHLLPAAWNKSNVAFKHRGEWKLIFFVSRCIICIFVQARGRSQIPSFVCRDTRDDRYRQDNFSYFIELVGTYHNSIHSNQTACLFAANNFPLGIFNSPLLDI